MGSWLSGNAALALAAAALWGVGDFSGGMGVKTAGGHTRAALRVVVTSHCLSFAVLLLIALLRGDTFPHGVPLLCGIAAGVTAALSLSAFYIALASGAMGPAAAISGLLAAAIPALVSIALEGTPGTRRILGFLVAGLAIWLIAATESPVSRPATADHRRTFFLAIAAGIGFGIYFVLLRYAGAAGVIWPMATARMGSISTCTLLLLILPATTPTTLSRRTLAWVAATAAFDTAGNLLFVAATRAGRLDVAAVLASLYPASTILLAAWLLRERLTRPQLAGMAVAIVAVVLVAL